MKSFVATFGHIIKAAGCLGSLVGLAIFMVDPATPACAGQLLPARVLNSYGNIDHKDADDVDPQIATQRTPTQ